MTFSMARQPRVISGEDSVAGVPSLLSAEGRRRVVVVTGGRSVRGRDQWSRLVDDLLREGIDFVEATVRGEPGPEIVDGTTAEARGELGGADAVVAIGGGSVLDTGKAVAAALSLSEEEFDGGISRYLEGVGERTHPGTTLPLYAVPTTAGTGSEATKNAVISSVGPGGFKKSLRHDNFVPHTAILDPLLHLGCPEAVTRAGGLDAITQLLEVYVSAEANPITDALSLEGLERAGRAFALLTAGEDNASLRFDMALAAYLSGVGLASAGLGLVHGFASPVGALREIPHGVVCGLLLGPVTAATVRAARELESDSSALERYARAARALGVVSDPDAAPERAVDRLVDWFADLAAPLGRLSDYGFTREDLGPLAEASGNKNSPVALDAEARRVILEQVL